MRTHGERRSGRPTEQTKRSAEAQGTRGRKPEKAGDNGGAQRKKKKKRSTEWQGGGQKLPGSNQHPGETQVKEGAHGEPRSRRPTKQIKHSAKAQGTRVQKPEKAKENGGARRKKKGGGDTERQR